MSEEKIKGEWDESSTDPLGDIQRAAEMIYNADRILKPCPHKFSVASILSHENYGFCFNCGPVYKPFGKGIIGIIRRKLFKIKMRIWSCQEKLLILL